MNERGHASVGGEDEAVRITLLGGFGISVGDRMLREDAWRLKKAASLVKMLALAPGHRLHREQAMDLLWPDLGTQAASNNLRQALYAARRILARDPATGSKYLASEDESLLLCPESPLWVDAETFEEAARSARRSREVAAYEAALELYAGDLLPQERYEEWAQEPRRRLRETCLSLLLGLAHLHEESREYDSAIEALRRVVSEEPIREEAHAGLMRLYALKGSKAQALAQYSRLEEVLLKELGSEPAASSRALREEIAAGKFPPSGFPPSGFPPSGIAPSGAQPPTSSSQETSQETPSAPPGHNLPASRSSFVGREREVAQIKRELANTRLLTLTGAGGTGKTRLALEVARDLAGAYPDGVWLVELAPLSEGALVPQAVAGALEVPERPGQPLIKTLIDALQTKEMLLVVDNCEHLVEAAASLVDELLESCPRLRVLATSREALCVEGEVRWPVPTLSVPDAHRALSVAELEGTESVRLFSERARSREPSFSLRPENAQAVAEICGRLDGIPLAIELAAARVGALSVDQILKRLEDSLKLLAGGTRRHTSVRQRTLRGALDWSYELLSASEQVVFRRLSVFAGGWTLEAAEAVVSGEGIESGDILDALFGLVEKSLVVTAAYAPRERGEVRYRMYEPIRHYALEKLEESGEAEELRGSHAEHFVALAEQAEPHLLGASEQAKWLERLQTEHDNIRAALSWSLGGTEPDLGLRLAGAVFWFWHELGFVGEGLRWLEEGLVRVGPSPTVGRAKALCGAGWLRMVRDDYQAAQGFLEESVQLYRQLGVKEGLILALTGMGCLAPRMGEHDRGVALLEEALALCRQEGYDHWIAANLINLAETEIERGEYDRAQALFEEAAPLFSEAVGGAYRALFLSVWGALTLYLGDHERAEELLGEALRLSQEFGFIYTSIACLETAAGVAGARGEDRRAAELRGAAAAQRRSFEVSRVEDVDQLVEPYVSAARSRLGGAAWEEALAVGGTMELEEAVEYALSEERPAVAASPTPALPEAEDHSEEPPSSLTRREREVASLVARGLTNRQIASELVLSEHTVHHHVTRVLKKLDLRSREQIASRLSSDL